MSEAARGMSGLMQTLTALEYACTLDVLPALKRIFASGERGPVFAKGYAFCSGADAMDLALHSDRQTLSVMENHDFHTLANEEGEDHIAHRKEVMAAFSPALLKRYGEVAERIATDTYGEPGASLVNLYEVTESFVQKLLWETLLGEPFDERPSHVLLDYQLLLARADNSARFRPSSIQAAKDRWNSYLLEILSKRYQLPKQDAASAIVRARKEPDAVGVSHLFALMDFGLGDLSIFFTYVLALLGIHREAQRSIRSELLARSGSTFEEFPQTAAFVHEVERLYPPVVELHRLVKKPFTFRNAEIREGTVLVCSLWHTQRDETLFPEPDQFRPKRFLGDGADSVVRSRYLLPFGGGRHMCLAAAYSRGMIVPMLRAVLRDAELYAEAPLPEIFHQPTQRPMGPIWLRIKRRKHP